MASHDPDDDIADLEIGIERGPGSTHSVRMRVTRPGSEAEERVACDGLVLAREQLIERANDAARYGEVLTRFLFSEPALRDAFVAARAAPRLRIRLALADSAADLHALRWETLRDPQAAEAPLLHDQRVLFSRYLASFDWRPVRLRPREELRALVVVADPQDLGDYGLARIDAAGELQRAREGLRAREGAEIPVVAVLPDPTCGRSTLERMLGGLRDGCDVLYLVCHGAFDRRQAGHAVLFFEDAEGRVVRVPGAELVARLQELEVRPRLIVLASCESAGTASDATTRDDGPLAALGPRLAEAGVPAVLAMQGRITMRTVARFMPVLFRELTTDGRIDRALAVARGAIDVAEDAWRPVLFMRLRRGRVWYEAGFSGDSGLTTWPSICQDLEMRRCTPFLGPGLLEAIVPHRERYARRWADEAAFPLAPSHRDDLTQVAQYLAISQKPSYPAWRLTRDLIQELRAKLGADAPHDEDEEPAEILNDLLDRWRTARFGAPADVPADRSPVDPYAALAALPLAAYVTTGGDDLLVRALTARGKQPEVGVFPWSRALGKLPDPFARDPDYEPSVKRPLVYHLFGRYAAPKSLVLTQDDHFDFLLAVRNPEFHDRIPAWLRARLSDSGLLFLGFEVESWAFRVVFRTLLQQEGAGARDDYRHVAAQVEPEEGRVLDPAGARRYLEHSLKNPDVDIYWGPLDRFFAELARRRKEVLA